MGQAESMPASMAYILLWRGEQVFACFTDCGKHMDSVSIAHVPASAKRNNIKTGPRPLSV
jgi:hypothetical protein